MWLIAIDTFAIALALTLSLTLSLTFTIPLALCTNVVAEHSAEDKILFWREFVQWAGDDEPDSFQALAPAEIDVQILLSGWL